MLPSPVSWLLPTTCITCNAKGRVIVEFPAACPYCKQNPLLKYVTIKTEAF